MTYTHLITVAELQALQASGAPLMVFDCSGELGTPARADAMFAELHIAGRADHSRLLWQLLMLDKSLARMGIS